VDEESAAAAEGLPAGDAVRRQVAELQAMVEQQAALLHAQGAALEAQGATIAALQQRLDRLPPAAIPTAEPSATHEALTAGSRAAGAPTSRRALLTRGSAAAAGAALVGTALNVASASPAAAATGVFTGDPAVSATAVPTTATAVSAQSDAGAAIVSITQTGVGVLATAADGVAAFATASGTSGIGVKGTTTATTGSTIGVAGQASSANGYGVSAVNSASNGTGLRATGTTGLEANATISQIRLTGPVAPPAATGLQENPQRSAGELIFDTNRDLWICVLPGNPGTWRRLAGPQTAGALRLLTATTRVYDSRPGTQPPAGTKGIFASHEERTIDTALAGVRPTATAVLINATATNTNPGGFFAFFRNGTTWPNNSSLSWGVANTTIANLAVVAVSNAKFTARMEGAGGADLIVDCIGYYE